MLVVGLDAASSLEKFGYAIGRYQEGRIRIGQAGLLDGASAANALATVVAPTLREAGHALIAIDAPLGWPREMADALFGHKAGDALAVEKNRMFQRETDRQVHARVGKKPLEIGADRIARAAHSALSVVDSLRVETGLPIPLAWRPDFAGVCAIEVYPAATLKVRDLPYTGYKKPEQLDVRRCIAHGLADELDGIVEYEAGNPDIFDACICLAAARDFLDGLAPGPADADLALREGWIWVRSV